MEKGDGIEIRKNGIDHSTQMLRAFAHFTLSMYDGKAMACDLQGVGYDVTDQQISHPVKGTFLQVGTWKIRLHDSLNRLIHAIEYVGSCV